MQNNLEDYEKINLKSTENFELYGDALPFALKYYIKELLLTNNNSHSAILIMDDFQYQSKKAMISTFENQGFNQLVIVIDNNHLSVYNFGGKKIAEYRVKDDKVMVSLLNPEVKDGPLYEFAFEEVAKPDSPLAKFEKDLEDSLRGVDLDQFYNAILA